MAAIRKPDPRSVELEKRENDTPHHAPQDDVREKRDLSELYSPARRMQADLQASISKHSRASRRVSIGCVLALSSGITTLLGVFIFTGIW